MRMILHLVLIVIFVVGCGDGAKTSSVNSKEGLPSSDCGDVSAKIETILCEDQSLASLDRDLTSAYSIWFKPDPPLDIVDDKFLRDMKSSQIEWINRRDQCVATFDVRECLVLEYESRLNEIDICSYYGSMMCSSMQAEADKAHKKLRVFYAIDKFHSAISKLKKSTPDFITTTINQWKTHVAKNGTSASAELDSGANCPGDNCWLDNEEQVQLVTNCVDEIHREIDGDELDKSIDGCINKYLLPPAQKGSLVSNPDWVFGDKAIDGVPVDCLPIKWPGSELSTVIDYHIRIKRIQPEMLAASFSIPAGKKWQSSLDPAFVYDEPGQDIDDYFLENPSEFWSDKISPFLTDRPNDYDLEDWFPNSIRSDAACEGLDSDDGYWRTIIAKYEGKNCDQYFQTPFECKAAFMAEFSHRNGNTGSGIYAVLRNDGIDYVVPIVLNSTNRIQSEPRIYER